LKKIFHPDENKPVKNRAAISSKENENSIDNFNGLYENYKNP
jgi:hypothetical protein